MITAVYACQKNEEQYIIEWIDYYINLGFDYIIIGDNNDIGRELKLPQKYSNQVIIVPLNYIQIRKLHGDHNLLLNNFNMIQTLETLNIDFVLNVDIDEFLELKGYLTIKDLINEEMIKSENNIIGIKWETYDDNGLIYKCEESNSVLNDYKHNIVKQENPDNWCVNGDELSFTKIFFNVKYVLKNKYNLTISSHSIFNFGTQEIFFGKYVDTNSAVINHFRTKCLEQYLYYKCFLNGSNNEPLTNNGNDIIKSYFIFNKITQKKLIAAKEICEKYKIQLSESDIKFIEDNL